MTAKQLVLPGMVSGKKCSRCGEFKVLEQYYKGQRWCKLCQAAYRKVYREMHKEEIAARCKAYRDLHKEEIVASKKAYRETHKEEIAVKSKAYYETHKDEIAAKSRAYYKTHKDEVIASVRVYRADHKKEIVVRNRAYYETHKEESAARTKRWKKENPERRRAIWRRYRAAKANLPGSHTTEEWLALCAEYPIACPCCGKPWSEVGAPTFDHVIPVTWPGSTDYISNIQPLCKSCNASKGNRHDMDYRHGEI